MIFILKSLALLYPVYFYLLFVLALFFLKRALPVVKTALAAIKPPEAWYLLVLMLAGCALRLAFSSHIDFDFYGWSYVRDALAIKKIIYPATAFNFSLLDAVHIPGFSCLILLPLLISESLSAVSIFNLSLSVLTVPVVYGICRLLSREWLFALAAAGLVAFSPLHIQFSAEEIPLSASVLFIAASFLFFILWLSTKRQACGWVFVTFFFIALNVKIENCLYAPVFAVYIARNRTSLLLRPGRKKFIVSFLMLAAFSSAFWLPYIIVMGLDQMHILQDFSASPAFFSFFSFLRHCLFFLVQRTHGFVLGVLAAYALTVLFRRRMNYGPLIIGWFIAGLLSFFWYADIFSLWNMLQIWIPLFIICAYVIFSFTTSGIKNVLVRGIVCAGALFLMVIWSNPGLATHAMTWVDIKRQFRTDSGNQCLAAPDSRLTLPLAFLFPGKRFVFLDDYAWRSKLSACQGSRYYFNPIAYGLAEEIEQGQMSLRERALSEDYLMQRDSSLHLYKLTPR